jgi:acyl-coenzyme A thioesterase PaaI-like protein
VTGCLLQAVSTHFSTSLAKQNQPHTIALHVEFLRRTQAGPATFIIEDVKLGRQASVVHVHMSQDGRDEIVAYATQSNMDTEEGVSFDMGWKLHPPPPSVDIQKLELDTDPNWKRLDALPHVKFRKATQRVIWHLPRHGHVAPNLADEWIRFADGTNFTNTSLGYVVDVFPQIIERFLDKDTNMWYPTVLLNLDVKKTLPSEGVRWLGVRCQMKKVHKGRVDIEVHVHDAGGELIAISNHVGFVVDASRNLAARRKKDTKI